MAVDRLAVVGFSISCLPPRRSRRVSASMSIGQPGLPPRSVGPGRPSETSRARSRAAVLERHQAERQALRAERIVRLTWWLAAAAAA